ncbi:DHH family phosphoesterase [Halomarina ordinaria]|uniref:Bifunctional oligoribonuclease/PAP phosphatase NrnA n=1 Tax=Halomarina ordinaria TaxID=3033939 RepID=A0ABD5U4P6_9EURY|nr:DHHA1 domain-containing protein [Halomarina sp. PSRA2]
MGHAQQLVEAFDGAGSVLVVCHANPDPDCIASALALETIAHSAGVETVRLVYTEDLSHQENRAFVNLLDVDLREAKGVSPEGFDRVALVGHTDPTAFEDRGLGTVDVVVDHRPCEGVPEGAFVDCRTGYATTAAILVEYLRDLSVEPSERLASALLFALHRERLDHVRNPTANEYAAGAYVRPYADVELVEEMYGAAFSPTTLDAIGEAIRNREVRGSVLVTSAGITPETDALPQAARYLLNLEGVRTVLVFGIVENDIRMSIRSTDPRVNAGAVLEHAFDDVGSAGGYRDMGEGEIPLGLFADAADDTIVLRYAAEQVTDRFFDEMHLYEGS